MESLVPLLQTIAWIGLIIYGARKFSSQLVGLISAVESRIKSGSSFKAGPVELGEDLKSLEKLPSAGEENKQNKFTDEFEKLKNTSNFEVEKTEPELEPDWANKRNSIYEKNQGLFLSHVISPSTEKGQKYDIFIYLVRHKSKLFDDVLYAEFFLGRYWGNKIYKETVKDGLIGISTAAYGPFLCTCKVSMKDGSVVNLHRYIDFEMGRVYE
jgi:pYEATS domain-containing protein involved in immunity